MRTFKISTAIIHVLFLSGAVAINACQAPQDAKQNSEPVTVTAPSNADFKEGVKILYNAATRYEYPKAIEHLEAALRADPMDTDTKFHLVYAYLKRSKYDDARALSAELKNGNATLSDEQSLWLDAMSAKIEDKSEAEIRAWQKVLKNNPADRWAWYELSAAQSTMELYADAAISAEEALKVEADASKWEASWIYYLLSKAYYRSGQYSKGVEAAKRGKDNQTTWRSTYFRQSLAELKAGQVSDHERVVTEYLDVSNKEGRNNLGYTYANIALFYHELGDLENAEIYARKSYAIDPKGYQYWALGFILADNGKAEEALNVLMIGAEAFPKNNYVHAAKGWTLYRLGRHEEAQAAFKEAKAHSNRRNYSLEGLANIIDEAIANPKRPAAVQIPWLG